MTAREAAHAARVERAAKLLGLADEIDKAKRAAVVAEGKLPPDSAWGLSEGEVIACQMMNALVQQNEALLAIAKRWCALEGGAWHPVRYASEQAELRADTRAAIANAQGQS